MWKSLLTQVFLFNGMIGCATAFQGQEAELSRAEHFNCGELGSVMMKSSRPIFSKRAGHAISAAEISISSKKVQQRGILHSFMGGTDRTFTRRESDSFRSIDETNANNPIIMSIRMGDFIYGKKRAEIAIVFQKEAYTCVPAQKSR